VKTNVIFTSAALALLLGIVVPAYAQQDQKGDKQDQTRQQQGAKERGEPEQQSARQQQGQDRQQQQAQQQQKQNQSRQQDQRAQQRQYQDKQQQQAQQQQKQNQSRQQDQRAQQRQYQDRQQQQAQQQQKQNQSRQQEQRAQQQQYQGRQQQAARQEQRHQRSPEQQQVWQSTWQNHRAENWQSDHRTWQQRGGYNGYRIPEDRYRGYFGPQHWFGLYGLPFMVYDGYPRFQYQGYWITLLDPWPQEWSNNWYDNDDVYIAYGNEGYYMYDRNYPGFGIAISISR
jgi:hypothetical protein